MKGILTSRNQVLLLLRPDGLAVGIVTEGEDGNEHFHAAHLARHIIYYLKLVAGIVNIHLVAGHVLNMTYGTNLTLVATDGQLELTVPITIRMVLQILIMERFDCHTFLAQTLHVVGNESIQFHSARRRGTVAVLAVKEHILKLIFRQGQHLVGRQAALLILANILANCVAG